MYWTVLDFIERCVSYFRQRVLQRKWWVRF